MHSQIQGPSAGWWKWSAYKTDMQVVGWSASEEPNTQRVYRVPNDQTRIQEQTLEKAARARMVGGG